MLTEGELVAATLEKPAVGGSTIARVGGQVVLVSGGIPGERIVARVSRIGRGVVFADVVGIDEPSPDRRTTSADPMCGGCAYAHIAYPRQLAMKSLVIADALARIGRVELTEAVRVAASPEEGYRMRARLHQRDGELGFFREGTHQVCNPRTTRQLLPATCAALDRLGAALRTLGLPLTCEIELSENTDASGRVVHVESDLNLETGAMGALQAVARNGCLTGMTIADRRRRSGRPLVTVAGSPFVSDTVVFAGTAFTLRRSALAFFQGNRFLWRELLTHVLAQIPDRADVIDLYAGVGLFSIGAAVVRGARATAVEGDTAAAADLRANVTAARAAVTAVHQPVEAFLAGLTDRPGIAIVDPPRTGLSNDALTSLRRLTPSRVVYVSCDPATLARDIRRFVERGYRIERLEGFDFFPNTPHVETVATLTNN